MDEALSFSDIVWGEDDAKADKYIADYFVEYPGFDKLLEGKKRYVIGRKGSGKTAVLQKIKDLTSSDPQAFSAPISLRDFPLMHLNHLAIKVARIRQSTFQFGSFCCFLSFAD